MLGKQEVDEVEVPLAVQRQEWEAAARQTELPSNITIVAVDAAGVPGEWVRSSSVTQKRVFLYLHGGGYTSGSCITHRELAAQLCLTSGIQILLINYRLAPEHRFPAAVEDAVATYQWLLEEGVLPEQIVIGGDSAGGGLAMATLLWLRERGTSLPATGVLLSPWLDLTFSGSSIQTHARRDPLVTYKGLMKAAKHYLGDEDPKHPLASPLLADVQGLPPLLLQVGADEILLSDSIRLAEKAEKAGVKVTLEVWDEMWHVWQAWAKVLPEGQQAIEHIGRFLKKA
jgi:acetyl esterase/lipase